MFPTSASKRLDLNGSTVTSLTTSGNIHTTIAGGVGTVWSHTPNVYGDRAVAARIVNSLTPATKVSLIHLGDSRTVDQGTEQALMTYGFGVPWGGRRTILSSFDVGGPWTNTIYGPTTSAVSTHIDTYLGRYSPGGAYWSEMSAGPTPGGSNERIYTTGYSYSSAVELAQAPQMTGHTGRASLILRSHSAGINADRVQFWYRGAGYVKTWSRRFSSYAASNTTSRLDITIPSDFDYATNTQTFLEVGGWGDQVAGESLDIIDAIVESDIGVTHVNYAVGGRTQDSFLNNDMFDPVLWTDCISLYSGEKILWLSLGTNGCGFGAAEAATFKAKTLMQIAEFRAVYPNGLVLLDTAYLSNIEVGWLPGRRRAYIDIANEGTGILCLDTIGEMGHYEGLLAAALYTAGDSVHFNALGRQHYARCVSDMIARAAA